MEIRGSNPFAAQATNNQQPQAVDIVDRITKLTRDQQGSLVGKLKETLSLRLGDSLDSRIDKLSGDRIEEDGKIVGEVLTSLKETFLRTPFFIDSIRSDFQTKYSRIAKGEGLTYTLEDLRHEHKFKRDICTSTPQLDPLIQKALFSIIEKDKDYILGFELDMIASKKQGRLVFAIFEMEGTVEISRTLVPESQL